MRRTAAGHETHLAEAQRLQHFEGGPQVSEVYRIECTAKNSHRAHIRRPLSRPIDSSSSLSDLGLIYCDGGKSVQFADPFRQIAGYSPQTIGKLASIFHRLATIA
jgi:hypothetical protein